MDAKQKLKLFKIEVEKELKEYFKVKTKEAAKISPYCKELMEHISDITMRGGKRIRAALLYYSYLAHGGTNKKQALRVSMSMELAQTFLLIHDDIIDNDSLRRGGLTIHKSYELLGEERYHGKTNTRSFGSSVALLAGDLTSSLSNEVIAESRFAANFISQALLELNQMYTKEYYGQFLDVLSELREDVGPKDVILTHQLKTVPYTFDSPIKIGAILAGASSKNLHKLSDYASPLGVAFQIQDDILGMFGSEEKVGKPVTSDLREGKRTLLILNALEKANKEQKLTIEMNLGNRRVNVKGLKDVRKVIKDTGAFDRSRKLAKKYVNDSLKSLSKNKNLRGEGKDFLLGIAEHVVNREY